MATLALLLITALSAAAAPLFTDATAGAGLSGVTLVSGSPTKDYIIETIGVGAAAFDFDNDGWQDLYVANGSRLEGWPKGSEPLPRLFRNRGDGTFADVTAGSGLDSHFWGFGAAAGDYDNDGLCDLYVTAWGPDRLYRNRGDGKFEEVGGSAGLDERRWGASAAFADFDGDGHLDLYVANYVAFSTQTVPKRGDPRHPCHFKGHVVMCGPQGLEGEVDILYHNNGDGTFTDVTRQAGIRTDIGMFGLGVVAADLDEDGDVDIHVANDTTPNQLYRNRGDGTFDEVGAVSGIAYGTDGTEQGSMGTSAGDYDGDGRLDLVVTNFSHQFYQVFRYAGDGFFDDVSFATGIAEMTFLPLGWATDFFDYDNDGWLDLFFANGHVYPTIDEMQVGSTYLQSVQLVRNVPGPAGTRIFVDVSRDAGPAFATPRTNRGGGPFDYDRDGDLDLFLTVSDGEPLLLRNEVGSQRSWAVFRLVGKGSNRSAIGTRLTATAGGRRILRYAMGGGSFLWSADQRIHFGLGDAGTIDRLEVVWPGGARQQWEGIAAGKEYLLVQGDPSPVALGGRGRRDG